MIGKERKYFFQAKEKEKEKGREKENGKMHQCCHSLDDGNYDSLHPFITIVYNGKIIRMEVKRKEKIYFFKTGRNERKILRNKREKIRKKLK